MRYARATEPEERSMQYLDEYTVTEAALAQMANTADPRLKQIMDAAVRHLHAFAREVQLTPDEWLKGIQFLTAVGDACTPFRQEFILLADVLGVSALVNAMHDKKARELGTQSSLLGPFYREGAPQLPLGASIVAEPTVPEIVVYGRVTDNNGNPVPNAFVQVWQTSEHGLYDLQAANAAQVMDLRANFRSDEQGRYHFRTVRPLGYSIPMDGPVGEMVRAQRRHGFRPSHIHFLIGADGYRELVTALYFGDDEHIDSDTVFGVSGSLVVHAKEDPDSPIPGFRAVRYDFRLAHAETGETGRVGADPSKLMKAAE
jgi:protocatechuate 3,4-dioxygenase beta subunit